MYSRGSILPVRIVSSAYWCPAEAWLQAYGPRLAWNAPHYDHDSSEAREAIAEAVENALNIIPRDGRVLYEPYIYSRRLRLGGKPDLLAEADSRIVVVELKARRPLPGSTARVQAALYTVIAEHYYGMETEGYIAYPGGLYRVREHDTRLALRVLDDTRKILAQPTPPPPRGPPSKCRTCIYRHVCPWSRI